MSSHFARYITTAKFAEMTGYTVKACERKIGEGVWVEGVHYRRAPDGRILLNIVEYEKWVETGRA